HAGQIRANIKTRLRSLFVGEKLFMRSACSTPIQTEIITTRRIKPLMPEQLFNMSDRTAIEKKGGGHGVPQNMRADRFRNVCTPAIDRERVLDPIALPEATRRIALGHKEGFIIIPPLGEIPLKPLERTVGKKEQAFLVAFPTILASLRSLLI